MKKRNKQTYKYIDTEIQNRKCPLILTDNFNKLIEQEKDEISPLI